MCWIGPARYRARYAATGGVRSASSDVGSRPGGVTEMRTRRIAPIPKGAAGGGMRLRGQTQSETAGDIERDLSSPGAGSQPIRDDALMLSRVHGWRGDHLAAKRIAGRDSISTTVAPKSDSSFPQATPALPPHQSRTRKSRKGGHRAIGCRSSCASPPNRHGCPEGHAPDRCHSPCTRLNTRTS